MKLANILVIGKYYYPFMGGIEENTRLICERAAQVHQVTVLAYNHEPGSVSEVINGVQVHRRAVQLDLKGQPVSLSLLSGIRLSDYDLIHFHSPNPFASALLAARSLLEAAPPLVVTHHMDIHGRKLLRSLALPVLRHTIRAAACTIVTSAKNHRISRDLPSETPCIIVPLGLDPAQYQLTGALRAEGRQWRNALSGTAPMVGFLGRHARYKGLDVMLHALARLPGVHAAIAGDGPCRQAAELTASQLGIDDRVHFLGAIDHAAKLSMLSAIDAFIFPSTEITETFGISQMEAMLCGAPVIASNLPTGVTDVAVDGETALLVPVGSVEDLATGMARLLSDRTLAQSLARHGQDHVRAMTADAMARKILAIFDEAMSQARVDAPLGAPVT